MCVPDPWCAKDFPPGVALSALCVTPRGEGALPKFKVPAKPEEEGFMRGVSRIVRGVLVVSVVMSLAVPMQARGVNREEAGRGKRVQRGERARAR